MQSRTVAFVPMPASMPSSAPGLRLRSMPCHACSDAQLPSPSPPMQRTFVSNWPRLTTLCTNLIRVAATNDGRSQYGDRSGFYGLPNRGKETSRCQRCSHLGPPQYAERKLVRQSIWSDPRRAGRALWTCDAQLPSPSPPMQSKTVALAPMPASQPTLPAVRHAILALLARPPPQRCPHCRKWVFGEQRHQ